MIPKWLRMRVHNWDAQFDLFNPIAPEHVRWSDVWDWLKWKVYER